jgi:hypothetical protein
VEFRLLYSGRLLGAARGNPRVAQKHAIRKEFHPQLRRLWSTHHNLIDLSLMAASQQMAYDIDKPSTPAEATAFGVNYLAKWEHSGYKFLPLITEKLRLRCSLEILLLRPEEPRFIIKSGDLDARLKTIFDALRVPVDRSEIGEDGPAEGETPFYCLLEDDKLISEVSVTTDQLLLLPQEKEIGANDVFLVINVKVQRTRRTGSHDWVFD